MNTCQICNELTGNIDHHNCVEYTQLASVRKTVIATSEHFSVIPSIGALNKSHVLIVPNEHYLSFSSISIRHVNELSVLKEIIRKYNVDHANKKIIFFEHGTGTLNNNSGACIEHAHLHGIWEQKHFSATLFEEVVMRNYEQYSDLANNADKMQGYIYFEDSDRKYWLANNPDTPSQYFRFLYSKMAGITSSWNWKILPRIDTVNDVLVYYNDLKI
jgi:diadenosine tetraphosphate (Ap4A) HIT family hydrolase